MSLEGQLCMWSDTSHTSESRSVNHQIHLSKDLADTADRSVLKHH